MGMQRVGVVGCGLMGSGIAQVAAAAGYDVVIREVEEAFLEKGLSRIRGSLGKLAEKGKITEDQRDQALARLEPTTDLAALADCDLVIEAIIENLDTKNAFFAELGGVCKQETIFASNTSSFPIGEMGEASGRPDRFIGLHFFNPVPLMKLVEVVRAEKSSDASVEAGREFGLKVGKVPVLAKDTPGFIVNRLLVPYMADAVRMVERGDATAGGHRHGAWRWAAAIPMGPDHPDWTTSDWTPRCSSSNGWHSRYPDRPDCSSRRQMLKKMVDEGQAGSQERPGLLRVGRRQEASPESGGDVSMMTALVCLPAGRVALGASPANHEPRTAVEASVTCRRGTARQDLVFERRGSARAPHPAQRGARSDVAVANDGDRSRCRRSRHRAALDPAKPRTRADAHRPVTWLKIKNRGG